MGFEWTYEGDGPRQLALALLGDHLGDRRGAGADGAFMRDVVAELDNAWMLTSEEIDAALAEASAEGTNGPRKAGRTGKEIPVGPRLRSPPPTLPKLGIFWASDISLARRGCPASVQYVLSIHGATGC